MKKLSVTVIIPTYNYGHYLLDTLNSVSKQSFTDWECIVVDDGSTDNTKTLVEDYIRRHAHQQFSYIYIQNSGTSVAKNTGIDLARGRYIQFLDADDLLSEHKLGLQFACMESQDCALVFSRSVFFKNGQEEQAFSNHYPEGFLAETSLDHAALLRTLIMHNIMTISSPLVHKALVLRAGKFQPELKNNEDWLLWFQVALLKPIFIFDGDVRSCSKIRIHPNSAMRMQLNMFLGEVIVRHAIDAALQNFSGKMNVSALGNLNMDLLALHRVRSLDWATGWRYIAREVVKHPVQRSPLLGQGLFRSFVRVFRHFVPNDGT